MDFLTQLQDNNLSFLPIVIFIIFGVLGLLIGAINGWKTALYFLVFNLAILITVVFAAGSTYKNWLNENSSVFKDLSIKGVKPELINLLKGLVILVLIFVSLLAGNIILFIIYLFIRRFLKRSMKLNRLNDKSNVASRVIGSIMGLLTSIPMALAPMALWSVSIENKGTKNFVDELTNAYTLNQAPNITGDIEQIYNWVLISDGDSAMLFSKIFSGDPSNLPEDDINSVLDNKEAFVNLLNGDKSYKIIADIIKDNKQLPKASDLKVENIPYQFKGILDGVSKERLNEVFNQVYGKDVSGEQNIQEIISKITSK